MKKLDSGVIVDADKWRIGWAGGQPETPCGYGSRLDQTVVQRRVIAQWVKQYKVQTVVDVGAGDLNWIKRMHWPHRVAYTALDLVPRCAEVEHFDIIHDVPPDADMVLCLWVLNHLPENHARMALANILASDSEWLVYTWWPAMAPFLNLGAEESVVIRARIGAELRLVRIQCTTD